MALPTRNQVRTVIVSWWQEAGRPPWPRLARLRALLTPLVTPPHNVRSSVVVRITTGPLTLHTELVQWDANGEPVSVQGFQFTPADFPGGVANLDEIIDDYTGKLTRAQHAQQHPPENQGFR